jgi:hypothetical protein
VRPALFGKRTLHRRGADDRGRGRVECHKEPVAGGVHHLASVVDEHRAQGVIAPAKEVLPRPRRHGCGDVRRGNDVGDHERLVGDAGCGIPLGGCPNGVGRRSLIPYGSQAMKPPLSLLQAPDPLVVSSELLQRRGRSARSRASLLAGLCKRRTDRSVRRGDLAFEEAHESEGGLRDAPERVGLPQGVFRTLPLTNRSATRATLAPRWQSPRIWIEQLKRNLDGVR